MTRSGILLVDKTQGITSHDAVSRTRKLAGTRKVGHAGTLDPMATGLLVLGLNSSTRLLTFLVGLDKEYVATVRLGQATNTDDADGTVTKETSAAHVSTDEVSAALATFVGTIEQVPSSVSAIKVDGKRAYALVRAGETVELAARSVTIAEIAVLDVRRDGDLIDVDIRVSCSSGTYIRAIARDLGAVLDVGGHLTALRRTRVGPFSVDDAIELGEDTKVVERMLDPVAVATLLFPARELVAQEVVDLVQGKRIDAGTVDTPGPVAAVGPGGILVGIVERAGGRLKPIVNFPTDEVLE
jgi:tRNA pseudouridine55 synthase